MQGAQFVGSTFKGITQTLSQTVKGFAGEGGSLSKGFEALWGGTKDVFSGRAGMGTLKEVEEKLVHLRSVYKISKWKISLQTSKRRIRWKTVHGRKRLVI